MILEKTKNLFFFVFTGENEKDFSRQEKSQVPPGPPLTKETLVNFSPFSCRAGQGRAGGWVKGQAYKEETVVDLVSKAITPKHFLRMLLLLLDY